MVLLVYHPKYEVQNKTAFEFQEITKKEDKAMVERNRIKRQTRDHNILHNGQKIPKR
jgi:RNase P protein component